MIIFKAVVSFNLHGMVEDWNGGMLGLDKEIIQI